MKKIVFLTGTRADYGKIKSIMRILEDSDDFKVYIYVTGMHLLKKYGSTYLEIEKDGFNNIFLSKPISRKCNMSEALAKNVEQFNKYVMELKPDMIFVHGDRLEALAGAIVGALNNIYVSHIEGGEISGTIDESIRHSISKLANFHFVSNVVAKKNLIQMGEKQENIFVIGSPDIDVMLKNNFDLEEVKSKYAIDFKNYSIFIYHPVVTEINSLSRHIRTVTKAIVDSNHNYIIIYPNNDLGSDIILKEYKKLKNNKHIKMFPSIRFEYFLTLLKNADFVIGNSSLGIRESGVYGIPTINIGTRQNSRYNLEIQKNLCCVSENYKSILKAISNIDNYRYKDEYFGNGDSDKKLFDILNNTDVWKIPIQKKFISIW